MASHPESPNPDATPPVSDSGAAEAEVLFGRYRVERELGRGGMGRVLLAFDTKLRIYVAVKLVPEQLMADAESAEDLRREVLRGIALTHPAIVRTHTFEQDANGAGIVMEYIDGLTFTEWKEQQPNRCFDPEQLFPWLGLLCEVLDYAHREARIVHRDLKPRNLMISQDGKLKVADFGIAATLTDTHSRVTGQGGTSGTPAYMSPQQARGKRPSPLDDIYALGATLYDLIAGKPPFFRGTHEVVLMQVVSETPISMTERREELGIEGMTPIPEVWERTIAACLAKEPEERPQSGEEVLLRLQGFVPPQRPVIRKPVAPEPVTSMSTEAKPVVPVVLPERPGGGPRAVPAPPPRSRRWIGLAISAAVVVLVAVLMWAKQSKPAGGPRSVAAQTSVSDAGEKVGGDELPPSSAAPAATPAVVAATPVATTPKPATPAPAIAAQPATPAPTAATPKPPSEIEKWLAQVDGIYRPRWQKEVSEPYESGLADLQKNYLAALDAQITAASRAAKLPDALAFRNERQRIESDQGVPADDNDTPPAALKTLRAAYRTQFARLEADRSKNAATVFEQYDKVLATNQAALTQRQRLDEAPLLQQRRDGLAKEWMTPPPKPGSPAVATKERPFVNALGMKFVPVPGTKVLVSIWHTRVQDYAAYARTNNVADAWKTQLNGGFPVGQAPDHPVVAVSWQEAQAFCEWLTERDRAEGKVPKDARYRLPTDEEWSVAAGLTSEVGATPEEKHGKNTVDYPWGTALQPDGKVGNYSDAAYREQFPQARAWIEGYTDGYATTSPVGSFPANAHGLYDMGGNVWQWCEDWWNSKQQDRVLRGGSWLDTNLGNVLSSYRVHKAPGVRKSDYGFRCVLALSTSPAAPASASSITDPARPVPTSAATPTPLPTPSATPARSSLTAAPSIRPDPALGKATKDAPFTNTLGMKFVPVPGTKVLFCIHETRRQDYAAYATGMPGVDASWNKLKWYGVPYANTDDEPVAGVNWLEAEAFCAWLSKRENMTYRLPTDREWSYAVGIGHLERWRKDTTPEMLNRKLESDFPWGNRLPPSKGAGNYADTAWHEQFPTRNYIQGYDDGFAMLAPVMSFAPNKFGIYDLGGNVAELVADWFNLEEKEKVLRGGAFTIESSLGLLSSVRRVAKPTERARAETAHHGFRCVVELPAP